MSNEDLKMEQYKIYVQKADRFTDRSFNTNKFFILVVFSLFVATCIFPGVKFRFFTAPMIFSFLGMIISFLWWSNVDTYGVFNKIKIKNVIDKLEEQMPFQPHMMEKQGFDEIRSKNKAFVFSDIQKILALCVGLIFMTIFVTDLIMYHNIGF